MALSARQKKRLAGHTGRQLARFCRFVLKTSNIVFEPSDGQARILEDYPPIVAVWHGQFMMVAALQPEGFEADAIVARHGDAEVIAEALLPFNVRLVRGAGSQGRAFKKERGGVAALRQAVRALESNRAVVTTADVPPGPARIAGSGVVTLAKLSGRPVVPVAVATSRYRTLNTWSRMTINLPYSKLACVVGDKIWVPEDATPDVIEEKRVEIEQALNAATLRAYEAAGADLLGATPPSAVPPEAPLPKPGVPVKLYRAVTNLARPLSPILYKIRSRRGKEDVTRRNERFGQTQQLRPTTGPVAWIHAASVGETNAVLPVVDQLMAKRPDLFVVLTTGTVTSAAMVKSRLGPRAVHQFVPYDSAEYAKRFLEHWKPDLAIFTESEIWPNLILETADQNIPLALVNGRMSKRSHSRWRKRRGLSLPLFARFRVVLAQNAQMARRFSDLGARTVINAGNLKVDAPPPPIDQDNFDAFKSALNGRPVFVAASTHDGEDTEIIHAHRILLQTFPNLCTIIAPRHPERGTAISELAKSMGRRVKQRSLGQMPSDDADIYIADSIGELGLFYALTDLAFIGGSLIEHGGQNPLEAARLGTAIITGPSRHNFSDIYRALSNAGAVREVGSADALANMVLELRNDPSSIRTMQDNAAACLDALGGALRVTTETLLQFLPAGTKESSRAAE